MTCLRLAHWGLEPGILLLTAICSKLETSLTSYYPSKKRGIAHIQFISNALHSLFLCSYFRDFSSQSILFLDIEHKSLFDFIFHLIFIFSGYVVHNSIYKSVFFLEYLPIQQWITSSVLSSNKQLSKRPIIKEYPQHFFHNW